MATERDRWVFDSLDTMGDNSEDTDLDVDAFFDMMEDMVNRHYDSKTGAAHGHYQTESLLAY